MAEVYWNSHKRCFSVKDQGRVREHLTSFRVENPTFHVLPRARNRVRRTGRKEVHATIRGEPRVEATIEVPEGARRVVYNPHIHDQFVDLATDKPILAGRTAFFAVVDNHPEVHVL